MPYGNAGCDVQIAGCPARMYELGPEPPTDDIDGRTPCVVTWHDGETFYLTASDRACSDEFVKTMARSLYE
jgi:hypothetical protein